MIKNVSDRFRPTFLLAFLVLGAACSKGTSDTTQTAPGAAPAAPAASPEAARMQQGVDLLYKGGDPVAAEQAFRDVLKANPSHYGAHFQLARALDRQGRPAEARTEWQGVLQSAESIKDTATAGMARARLAAPDTVGAEALMAVGMHDLYVANDPTAAADQFRKVLEKNPTHYGATFQLASALDKEGKPAEARPLWTKVLGMATTYKDTKTADAARTRLAHNP